jgi:hypothetical protein
VKDLLLHPKKVKIIKWINTQLREFQDQTIHLKEEKRILDDRAMEHFKECKPTRENSCATLSNAQSKLKRNVAMFSQVGNFKVQNLSLRKENRHLEKRLQLNDEAKRRLELLAEVVKI